jgi:hypothetical protein
MSIVLCVRPIVGTTQRLKVESDETERVDRECGTESSNRNGNGLHDDLWTLVQNPRRAWKKRDGMM